MRNNKKKSTSLSGLAWQRFKKNKLAMGGLFFIIFSILISTLGYLISPDSSPYVNDQFLELTTKKPGFSVDMLKVRKNETSNDVNFFSKMFFGEKSDYKYVPINNYKFIDDKIQVEEYSEVGEEKFISSYYLVDVLFPLQYNADIKTENGSCKYTTLEGFVGEVQINELHQQIIDQNIESKIFILGTDRFGRDMLSRLMLGARISLSVGFIAVLISLIIGISLGAIAGYYRGAVDEVIMWFINVIWSIPTLLLVIAITMALGKGFWVIFIAVGMTMWVEVARVVRGQVLSVREKEYVEACRALGYRTPRILFKHIIPNVMSPVIVISASNFASAILIEAGLSFLGIGVQPPIPSWGTMIKDHYGYIIVDLAYLAILPGFAIMLMVLSFILVGNGLRDALDTRSVD